jgi:hypothetical protein
MERCAEIHSKEIEKEINDSTYGGKKVISKSSVSLDGYGYIPFSRSSACGYTLPLPLSRKVRF